MATICFDPFELTGKIARACIQNAAISMESCMIVRWGGGGVMCLCPAHKPNTADAVSKDNVPLTIVQRLLSNLLSPWEGMVD